MKRPDAAQRRPLFPFLAVLICTMGALLVLLVVISKRAQGTASSTRQEKNQADKARMERQQEKLAADSARLHQMREEITHVLRGISHT